MYISTNERKLINQIVKLAAKKPEQCIIVKRPENNDGVLYGKFSPKFLRIKPPREIHYTEEQKAKMIDNLRRNLGVEDKAEDSEEVEPDVVDSD